VFADSEHTEYPNTRVYATLCEFMRGWFCFPVREYIA
jgi:hypothetical protein